MSTQKNKVESGAFALAGQWFHSIDENGKVKWQGTVIGSPEPGYYLVQLFSYLDGEPTCRMIVRFEDMKGWLFYEDAESMRFSYRAGVAREGGPYRDRITSIPSTSKRLTEIGE